MTSCKLCPRGCGIDRKAGRKGYCGEDNRIKAARAALHMWEEPCITGKNGSGTVFFSGCNLKCVYCQNYVIAHGNAGRIITVERLAEIFLELQEKGAHNINLVTPTHFADEIIKALDKAERKGLNIPIVYNCGGYESIDTIRKLEGYVDIFLTDFKYWGKEAGKRYSNVSDYRELASEALKEMVRITGKPEFTDYEKDTVLMTKGVIVRHLVLPGHTADSKRIIRYLHDTYGDKIIISIMNQYTPNENVKKFPEINHKTSEIEYNEVVDFAIEIGVENGFIQEGETADESFIPDLENNIGI